MKFSTNLLIGCGIATMAFNAFTTLPTLVIASPEGKASKAPSQFGTKGGDARRKLEGKASKAPAPFGTKGGDRNRKLNRKLSKAPARTEETASYYSSKHMKGSKQRKFDKQMKQHGYEHGDSGWKSSKESKNGHGYYGGNYYGGNYYEGKASKSSKGNSDYEMDCFFDDISFEGAGVCIVDFVGIYGFDLNIDEILSCDKYFEDVIYEEYPGCFESSEEDYYSEPSIFCNQLFDSISDVYDCFYESYDYCFVTDEEFPEELTGCIENFAGKFEDLSFDDIMSCTVDIGEIVEEMCYDSSDSNYDNTMSPVVSDSETCYSLFQCANIIFLIDECINYNFWAEGYNIENILDVLSSTSFPVDDVMNSIYDGSVVIEDLLLQLEQLKDVIEEDGFDGFVDCLGQIAIRK